MSSKQAPDPGKRYDEATHQWTDAVTPSDVEAAKPAPKNTAKEG